MSKGMGGYSAPVRGATDDWITPRAIVEALGPFDLDPCASLTQPWPLARDSGAPSVLIAYGADNAEALRACKLGGAFVTTAVRT